MRAILVALFLIALVHPTVAAPSRKGKGKSKSGRIKGTSKAAKTTAVPKGQAAAAAGKSRGSTDSAKTNCLDSTANDTAINLAFYYGGANTVVNLCPGATIKLYNPIFFTQKSQVVGSRALDIVSK